MNDSTSINVTAFYARKSRRNEGEYPLCDKQIDTCRLYALSQGRENCIAYVDDGKSGETRERAAWKRMLESLRRKLRCQISLDVPTDTISVKSIA